MRRCDVRRPFMASALKEIALEQKMNYTLPLLPRVPLPARAPERAGPVSR
jgi:hypothetical protein